MPTPRPVAVTRAAPAAWTIAGAYITGESLPDALDNAVAEVCRAAEERGGEWDPFTDGENCREALAAMQPGETQSWAFPDPESEDGGEARDVTPDMIAAAPDMLAALGNLLLVADHPNNPMATGPMRDFIVAARAAIAKAEGKA